ncbi:MAG: HAD hydrolase family protein [Lachnospiraceae bacterium]|nr:HAD hydrolase family protein [Lachnospiraceae bacterium]
MIKKISVFAADIDGTLAEKGGDLMPKTRAAIQRLHNEGVMIGIASGRPLDFGHTINRSKDWRLGFDFDFAIGMNGSDKTKAVAQAVTEYDVRHDGVGHYLEDHWFSAG